MTPAKEKVRRSCWSDMQSEEAVDIITEDTVTGATSTGDTDTGITEAEES